MSVADLGRQADLLVVLGGDGTILHVVEQLVEAIKPVFGINVGSLGFLTCANSSTYSEAVECIASGKMVFSDRTLLEVTIKVGGKDPTVMTGLNDVVLSRGEISRLIRLKARVNGEALTNSMPMDYRGDAHGIDGLFAFGRGADPGAGIGRIRDHADLSARAHQSFHHRGRERDHRDRSQRARIPCFPDG